MASQIGIREIKNSELSVLKEMLYQAIFQPEGKERLPKSIIEIPEISRYIDNWGQKDDYCLVADLNGQIIGAVWVRILSAPNKGYGHVDTETPEFVISLLPEFRNQGIGTALMKRMIDYLKQTGYQKTSLSVEKANYAVNLYRKLGFEIVDENKQDYIMILTLQ